MAQAAKQLIRHGIQVNHVGALAQVLPVVWPQHHATAGGQHAGGCLRQLVDDGFFDVTKAVFAFAPEVFTDRAAQALLDDVVGVEERQLKPPGKLAADRGFARAGQADEGDNRQGIETKNVDASLDGTVTVMATESPAAQFFKVTDPEVAISALGFVPG